MSLFNPPPKPLKPSPPPRRGERGSRVQYPAPAEDRAPSRRERLNVPPDPKFLEVRGFLLGDGPTARQCRWFYDLDGRYVRVRGRRRVVEIFGPARALAALTEDERHEVMKARRNATAAGRLGDPR